MSMPIAMPFFRPTACIIIAAGIVAIAVATTVIAIGKVARDGSGAIDAPNRPATNTIMAVVVKLSDITSDIT
jgi:hypothetical protein